MAISIAAGGEYTPHTMVKVPCVSWPGAMSTNGPEDRDRKQANRIRNASLIAAEMIDIVRSETGESADELVAAIVENDVNTLGEL